MECPFTLLRETEKAPPVRAGMNEGMLRNLGARPSQPKRLLRHAAHRL